MGSTIELVDSILRNDVQNGMAIIRPPGHHAMKAEYNGYCFFNNVAIAAQHALDYRGVSKHNREYSKHLVQHRAVCNRTCNNIQR